MATTLLTLLDDITTLLDDIAAMSKTAASKTAGVLGDDLALNAQQVSGVSPERELPVVWAVAKGSLINKAILVPLALLISAFIPWAVVPLLIVGGAYLCFEGVEKLAHKFLHPRARDGEDVAELNAHSPEAIDVKAMEKDKIRGAIRTDFILSAEIIVIALGTVATASLINQVLVLSTVAVAMTIGVYGLVGAIVKMDDVGLYLTQQQGRRHLLGRAVGHGLLLTAPRLMRCLSFVGTLAMFLVGGGILSHSIPTLHHALVHTAERAAHLPVAGSFLHSAAEIVFNVVVGVVAGALVLLVVEGISRMRRGAGRRKH